jgi:RNA polymerase sigma-70 factor (ECF subfamily)
MPYLQPTDIVEEMAFMRRYARSLARDDNVADDVVQDALLKALEKRHAFRPDGSPKRWLLSIVHNIFISVRRREQAEARRDIRFAQTLIDRLEPDQEHAACLQEVARAFAALPDHHRAVLHLVAVEGQSYQEAAAILDVPVGTVMSRLSRARAALRSPNHAGDARDPDRLKIVGGQDGG